MVSTDAGVVRDLVHRLQQWSNHVASHCCRAAELAGNIARCMGLEGSSIEQIEIGALLHDIGKINTPKSILSKPGRLSANEFRIVSLHPIVGAMMINHPVLADAVVVVAQHHERWDGTGYPGRLSRTDIALGARVVAVADAFDAMTSPRVYRSQLKPEQALDAIDEQAGRQFDPAVVEALMGAVSLLVSRNLPWTLLEDRSDLFSYLNRFSVGRDFNSPRAQFA